MHLLTWHGTLICLPDSTGTPLQSRLPLPAGAPAPLPIPAPRAGAETRFSHPDLGMIDIVPGKRPPFVSLVRGKFYLCAERDSLLAPFDREQAGAWEEFLPLSAQDVADLGHILGNRWIVLATRLVLRRDQISLSTGYALRADGLTADLAGGLGALVVERDEAERPWRILLNDGPDPQELALADARGSKLIATKMWPVRSRRVAEMLALAVHRHLAGFEPSQDAFERDTAFLEANGGPAALADLIESVIPHLQRQAEPPMSEAPAPSARAGAAGPMPSSRPVVSLGNLCITSLALRQARLLGQPLPFDWIFTTPAMVRHCIETDFSMLLDPSQYSSLTGRVPGEKGRQCDHLYYKQTYGMSPVFNHCDPTAEGEYRYVIATVDRFRKILAAKGPKLFVQCCADYAGAARDFAATAALLDRVTTGAEFLQVVVEPADHRLAVPLLALVAANGPHRLLRLQPTSQMGGIAFVSATDDEFLATLFAAHARRSPAGRLDGPACARALRDAAASFGQTRPDQGSGADAAAILQEAGRQLLLFADHARLNGQYRFALIEDADAPSGQSCAVTLTGAGATFAFAAETGPQWPLLWRATALAALLDTMLAEAPPGETRFVAALGDGGATGSVCFCADSAAACLVPDPDFVCSGGYLEDRALAATRAPPWAARAATVFWRGSTTGALRHPTPEEVAADDFTWLPRLELCRRARDSAYAAHFDVGVTDIVQIADPGLVARIGASGLMRPRVAREAFFVHKGILVIDGNTNAWCAMFCALLSGSCLFWVRSPGGWRQWYHERLVPWVHYVPVAADLSDLDDQVRWMLDNDAEAAAIAAAAQEFAATMTLHAELAAGAAKLRAWLQATR